MRRCLQLAQWGEGMVAPNPMVGAVLVHDGRIIGEGYHQQFGQAHAEVNCIASVAAYDQHLIPTATLYVSLEPCSHWGKTPPCADLIIQHKIPHVVVGCTDPFAAVSGRGIQKLKDAGITVVVGVLETECRELNKRFVCFQEAHRPYVILKWAQTADGFIAGASYERVSISNPYTNRMVHRRRSQNMSILVGTNTAHYDDPELTTRLWPGKDPVRLVLDAHLRLSRNLKLFDGRQHTVVFNTIKEEQSPNLHFYKLDAHQKLIPQLLQALYDMKLQSVLVEGGTILLQSFIDEGWWDEAVVITSQERSLPNGIAAPRLQQHKLVHTETIFSDAIHTYAALKNTLL